MQFSINLEDHLRKIQEEIVQVACFLRQRFVKAIESSKDDEKETEQEKESESEKESEQETETEKEPEDKTEIDSDEEVPEQVNDSVPIPEIAAQSDLKMLVDMGFLDIHKNIALLIKHKGDLVRVLDELLM